MPGTAYSVLAADVEGVGRDLVELANEGRAIIGGIVAHKTVEFLGKIVLADDVDDNLGLRSACMVAKKWAEGNKEVALLVLSINKVGDDSKKVVIVWRRP